MVELDLTGIGTLLEIEDLALCIVVKRLGRNGKERCETYREQATQGEPKQCGFDGGQARRILKNAGRPRL